MAEPTPEEVIIDLTRTGDVTAVALAHLVLMALKELAADDEWDCPPDLFTVTRAAVADPTGNLIGLVAEPLNLPLEGLEGWQISRNLLMMAASVAGDQQEAAAAVGARDIVGWLFVHEGWIVSAPIADMAAIEEVAQRREVHLHPQRQEVRVAHIADRAGYRYQGVHVRGGEIGLTVDRPGAAVRIEGGIPEALMALVAALP
jgi:hypothetical protein